MFSRAHKYVFIHIPKAAGSSIRQSLSDIDRPSPLRRMLNRMTPQQHDQPIQVMEGLHTHSDARQVREVIGTETYRNCFSFAFVRNPWDRMLSLYNNVWQGAIDRAEGRRLPKYLSPEEEIEDSRRVQDMGFRNWLLSEEYQTAKYGQSLTRRSQLEWLLGDDGSLITNFVGKVESINEDIRQIEQKIQSRIRLLHVNKSEHRSYRDVFCDETRDFVAHHYRSDIEIFGYTY